RGGLARWLFESEPALLLTEAGTEHKAGIWVVDSDPLSQAPLDRLGPDADRADDDELARRLRSTSMRLHGCLRDQKVLAGIGRRLANEICFHARLSPFASTASLGDDEIGRVRA